jgi:MFS family permease
LLKRDGTEKPVALIGALLLAASLWLMPRTTTTGQFLLVSAVLALGNGMLVPTLSGMASRHVHGRAQGRVLGLGQAAGAMGRFLGPQLAAIPLPANFSDLPKPLPAVMAAGVAHGYEIAFSVAAGIMVVSLIVIAIMKPFEIESPAEAATA